jgi:hypothetical protein
MNEVSKNLKSIKSFDEDAVKPMVPEIAAELPGVKNISCEMQQGNLIALVGRRGEGKTTLLKILGGSPWAWGLSFKLFQHRFQSSVFELSLHLFPGLWNTAGLLARPFTPPFQDQDQHWNP